tara:strand:- start:689 stop:1555 length:867 start_codon:yes stop_codon:yes gene_type:complete
MPNNRSILGIVFMIAGTFSLGLNDIIVKGLTFKFPVWEIVFFRALSGVIISIFLVIIFGLKTINTKKPIVHFIRAFSSVACVVLFFFGIKFLLLSKNQAIFHIAPIIASILAIPILGEKFGYHRVIAVLIGFAGTIIILKPGTDLFNIYALIPIGSAFFMSISYISTRYLMTTESSTSIVFFYSLALLLASFLFFPSNFVMPKMIEFIPLFITGIIGSIGHYFLSQAGKNAEVIVIAPFEYSSFIFVTILAYIFYKEVPDITIYIGAILIVISGIYIVYREQKNFKVN